MNTNISQKQIEEAILLGKFKAICNRNCTIKSQQRLRNIFNNSTNNISTTKSLIKYALQEDLSDADAAKMYTLIHAFLNKKNYRQPISLTHRKILLDLQHHKCAICGAPIDTHSPVDHIVPFIYVGDELSDNLQILCTTCNSKKNSNLDYQIRYLLGTV